MVIGTQQPGSPSAGLPSAVSREPAQPLSAAAGTPTVIRVEFRPVNDGEPRRLRLMMYILWSLVAVCVVVAVVVLPQLLRALP
ncbi:MAG: hypothetical protein K8T25_15455 [Planctomycetia bacterium]|nr:hypothetical protein [Planctomycetia bacterium]